MPFEPTIIDVGQFSLNPKTTITPPEIYIPLWWWSGGSLLWSGGAYSPNGNQLIVKGGTGFGAYTSANTKLHVLNTNWQSTIKYAFEATLFTNTGTLTAELWDITTNTGVSSSQISTTSGTATVLRSGQFTLTPGHTYGVSLGVTTTANVNLTDASLIVFPS